uniref:Retroviral envelope protein GP41-like domain-containing protein n=1 Tax=Macaca fascicularis TaxID=9541 RepID=A0A7N9DEG2_MACFA
MSLVAIASTAAVAGLALHQSIQNAEFVQQWHEQSHRLWLQQQNIDSQLAERLDNMEQALIWLGDQLTVLSTWITLQCDWNSTQFCVTPVPFNISQNWTKIRKLLVGHKNISLDIQELTQNISEAFQQQLRVLSGTATLQELGQRLAALNPWTQMKTRISTISGSILLWALGLGLLLLVIRCSLRHLQKQKTQEQIWATFLGLRQNKKGEMQGPLKTVC